MIQVCTAATAEALAVIDAGIDAHNSAVPQTHDVRALHVVATDSLGAVCGGAVGRSWGQCCELQQLWVHPGQRGSGLGRRLMQCFEAEAAARGCTLVYLETWTFQAPDFYAKLGYAEVLRTEGYAEDIGKLVMHKAIVGAAPSR